MPTIVEEAVATQRRYYSETATNYERRHAHEGEGDAFNRKFIQAVLHMLGAQSVLDVGTATGYRIHDFRSALPDAFVCGIEPVDALLGVALRNDVHASGRLIRGTGLALPFADASFDVVCEFSVLHHVRQPEVVVREMLRVARKAVVISDCNRFGQGNLLARLAKLAMYKTRTWALYDWLRTKGKGYRIKMVMPENIEIRNLYELAAAHTVQIRRLDYKRDSLQDIFLKAMEGSVGRL